MHFDTQLLMWGLKKRKKTNKQTKKKNLIIKTKLKKSPNEFQLPLEKLHY